MATAQNHPHPPSPTLNPSSAGPTAVGNPPWRCARGKKLAAKIISVDSMQVYRGLDIGTAKPTTTERARVPHHLIDVAELTEAFDAAEFVSLPDKPWRKSKRGRVPISAAARGFTQSVSRRTWRSAALR